MTKCTGQPPTSAQYMMSFLNAAPPRNEASRGGVRSLWSMVCKSLSLLHMKLEDDRDGLSVEFQGDLAMAPRW